MIIETSIKDLKIPTHKVDSMHPIEQVNFLNTRLINKSNDIIFTYSKYVLEWGHVNNVEVRVDGKTTRDLSEVFTLINAVSERIDKQGIKRFL